MLHSLSSIYSHLLSTVEQLFRTSWKFISSEQASGSVTLLILYQRSEISAIENTYKHYSFYKTKEATHFESFSSVHILWQKSIEKQTSLNFIYYMVHTFRQAEEIELSTRKKVD